MNKRILLHPSTAIVCITILLTAIRISYGQQQPWTTPDANQNISNTNTNGNVGIGTSTPAEALHLFNNRGVGQFQIQGGPSHAGFIGSWSMGGLFLSANRNIFTAKNHNTLAPGAFIGLGVAGTGDTYFSTTGTGVTPTITELMRIKASGFVGIGTSTPNYRLDVTGGKINASDGLCIGGDCKTAWSQVGGSQWTSGTGGVINYSGGNVGIGIAAPTSKLHVVGNGSVSGDLTAGGKITAANGLCIGGDCKTAWSELGSSQWISGTGGVINYSGGNVGIGSTSPGAKLDVVGIIRAGNANTNIGNHPAYGINSAAFWKQGSDYSLLTDGANTFVNAPVSTGNIYFRRANADFMVLLGSAGYLGIGTSTPNYRLDVVGGKINASDGLCIGGDCKTAWSQVGSSQWTSGTGGAINYASGNVGIGIAAPTSKLHVAGNGNITGDLTVGGSLAAKYQDVAEWVESSQDLSPGTVVIVDAGKLNQVIASTHGYDTRVAGVISLQPGLTLGEKGEGRVLVATTGRVRVKVDASRGPIQVGDLLVTSDLEGFAMKSTAIKIGGVQIHRPGTLIGKALEPLAKGHGEILVLLSLQ